LVFMGASTIDVPVLVIGNLEMNTDFLNYVQNNKQAPYQQMYAC
jgi:hypothetical protein